MQTLHLSDDPQELASDAAVIKRIKSTKGDSYTVVALSPEVRCLEVDFSHSQDRARESLQKLIDEDLMRNSETLAFFNRVQDSCFSSNYAVSPLYRRYCGNVPYVHFPFSAG